MSRLKRRLCCSVESLCNERYTSCAVTDQPIISIKDLNVTYWLGHKQEVRALEHISLSIYPGEFIIFFGPSGCGKSTLLYSIAGLETHARGEILVEGKNVATMDTHAAGQFRQKEIGMIFQAFYLISTLNVLDNVTLPQVAISAAPEPRLRRAKELLEHFGVGAQAAKRPTDLSGGQQQRVAICRSLMNDPNIILADEPVGNLDSKSANDVINLIRDLNARQKKTVILVTHDPSHLHFAHRVFHMRDGKIIDTKVNRAINQEVVVQAQAAKPTLPRNLELLVRSFSTLAPDQTGTMLIPFKAKEIVSELVSGYSLEELKRIEQEVQHLLIDRVTAPDELKNFLDASVAKGGMAFDHRTAVKLSERMQEVLQEIRAWQNDEQQHTPESLSAEEREIRFDLVRSCHIHFPDGQALAAFDRALRGRIHASIDTAAFEQLLKKPREHGGVQLHSSQARRVARRLDLLLLGIFRG